MDATGGGADKGIHALGYHATVGDSDEEQPAIVLNQLVETVRPAASGWSACTSRRTPAHER